MAVPTPDCICPISLTQASLVRGWTYTINGMQMHPVTSSDLPSSTLRKDRDSNPRNGHPFTAFRVRRHRPLGHLSNRNQKTTHSAKANYRLQEATFLISDCKGTAFFWIMQIFFVFFAFFISISPLKAFHHGWRIAKWRFLCAKICTTQIFIVPLHQIFIIWYFVAAMKAKATISYPNN